MCGRYASSHRSGEMIEIFEVEENDLEDDAADEASGGTDKAGRPSYNIAPTDKVAVVLERLHDPALATEDDDPADDDETDADDETGHERADHHRADDHRADDHRADDHRADDHRADDYEAAGDGEPVPSQLSEPLATSLAIRQLRALTWGLVPSWSKDRSGGARMINARAESLLERPAYRKAAVSRRCLVPADGWYEWQVSQTERDAKGKPRKQPFFMAPADGGLLAFAGIYEFWRDRELHADDPQAWLVTFAIVTTAAEPALEEIHDRMPLVLAPERWTAWLDPQLREPDAVRALLQAPQQGRFTAVPISTRVNSVRNDGPDLLEPARIESSAEQLF